VDVFLLPLERWAKELKAQRESDLDSSDGDGDDDDRKSADKWAPDFTQEGTVHYGMQPCPAPATLISPLASTSTYLCAPLR